MSASNGTVRGHRKVFDSGSSATRWDLVVIGDGYRSDELAKYHSDVDTLVENILSSNPFDVLRTSINITRVDVESHESGAGDLCQRISRATFFNANFCGENIPRLLVADKVIALDVAIDAVPEMNATVMIVNTETYGGSGADAVAVFSAGAMDAALHEMGHSHFDLADEYDYPSDAYERYMDEEPAEPNVTSDLSSLKWSSLVTAGAALPTMSNPRCATQDNRPSPIDLGAVGAFEGARYFRCGIYRPAYGCRMRTTDQPFCGVCSDAIARVLLPYKPRRRAVRS